MNIFKRLWKISENYHKKIVIGMILSVVTFAVYARALEHEFVIFDDTYFITENYHVQQGFTRESIAWAFGFTDMTYWKPLTWLSHMLDCRLYGLNAGMHVMTNLIVHILNSLLIFFGLRYMTGSVWRSAFIAGLFALHPLNVDSVAWISERKNVLSSFFWFLSILCYSVYSENKQVKYYLLTIVVFIMGLMTKPMLITLPFLLLLLDFWPLNRMHNVKQFGLLFLEKFPMILLSLLSVYLTLSRLGGDVVSTESVAIGMRIENAIVSYAVYLYKMVLPVKLAVFYPFPEVIPLWKVVVSMVVLIILSLSVIILRNKKPWLLTGWFWYIGTLIPAIGLVQGGLWPAMADRFVYIPLVGVFIMIVWEFCEQVSMCNAQRGIIPITGVVVGIIYGVVTYIQIGYWENSITLFQHAIEVTEDNYVAHNNIGVAFKKEKKNEEAYKHFLKAIELRPSYYNALNNIGEILVERGDYLKAENYFNKSITINPVFSAARNNLGSLRIKQGRIDEAVIILKRVVSENPNYVSAINNLASALLIKGSVQDAINYYKKALELDDGVCEAKINFAYALYKSGDYKKSVEIYQSVITTCQIGFEVHKGLGLSLVKSGLFAEAEEHFLEALHDRPEDYEVMFNLARLYSKTGEFKKSVGFYKTIIARRPELSSVYYNLACTYARMNDVEKSIQWLKIAVGKGYNNIDLIRRDTDLDIIRDDPRFIEILTR